MSETKRILALAIAVILLLASGGVLHAQAQLSEQAKIHYLLNAIGSSDLKFIREGEVHDGKDAEDHLREKLDFAGSRIKTAQQFIDYIATGSSITGRPYYVILKDGTKVKSKEWLEQKLKEMK